MANLLYLLGIASAVTAVLWVLRRTKYPPGAQRQLKLPTNQSLISQKLVEALPHIVLSHSDKDAFRKSIDSYWAQQEREVRQACIVQPREASEVASVINILKREHGRQRPSTGGCDDVLFAVRGGGQSPVPGGASAKGGVLIDLTLMREVTVSDDRESVALGAGTRWVDVLRLLDREGLTAVGGRSSDVGVAGGFLYAPNSQSAKAIVAFHDSVKRSDPKIGRADVDPHAAPPITCFTYVQPVGMQIVTVHLAYTNLSEEPKGWPDYWKTSRFASLWRLWSTFRPRTVTSAVIEMSSTSPPGQRWSFGTTTIKNDLHTIFAARAAHEKAIGSLRRVKGLIWTIVMQPLLPSWAAKGDTNVLGIHEETDDALVILSFSVYWQRAGDDRHVYATIRETIEAIEAVATANGKGHRFRYLNYCAQWQRPLEGYGEENLRFLTEVSRKYDPDGLFQSGCTGGFKLDP
ncbi:unnamed protein product [Aspergillus oryzae]|nr:unnamed protein product [Aspergillus oryzae]GMF92329.1 unnamed protein product [Aspergillus oryzae]